MAGAADACPNAEFRTGPSAGLPECRAYEQVSPVEKFGNPLIQVPPTQSSGSSPHGLRAGWSTADGGRIVYNVNSGAALENAARGFGYPVVADRTATGWKVRPAVNGPAPDGIVNTIHSFFRQEILSEDRNSMAFQVGVKMTDDQPLGSPFGYGGVYAAGPNGAVSWVSKPTWAGADLPPGSDGLTAYKFSPVGGSEDLSTIYFMTRQTLTEADGDSGRTWDESWALYKLKDGVLSNVGVLPNGDLDPDGSMSAGVDTAANQAHHQAGSTNLRWAKGSGNVVSRDGSRALFITPGERGMPGRVAQLYLHRDGQPSLLISKKVDEADPISSSKGLIPVTFSPTNGFPSTQSGISMGLIATADRDLTKILFATQDALVEGAPDDDTRVNTYLYDVAENSLQYLPDFDRAWNAQSRNRMGNVYRMSDDGSRIVYLSTSGEMKIWREGLSTISLGPVSLATNGNGIFGVQFSADAKTLIFSSQLPIAGASDHPAGGGILRTQVYRYNEDVDTVPQCVSCPPPGAAVVGPATFDLFAPGNTGFGSGNFNADGPEQSRPLSADGSRAFFTTSSALDERDHNAVADVYEWDAATDEVRLISGGLSGSRGDAFIDADETGDNVFFISEGRLTASDTDELYDMYVARRGGGFPDPAPFDEESSCSVSVCQGQAAAEAKEPQVGSASGSGSGNVIEEKRVRRTLRIKRAGASRGAVAVLRIRVPEAGRIVANALQVRRVTRNVSEPGSVRLRLRLAPRARKALRQGRRVNASVRVAYRPAGGRMSTRRVRVVFGGKAGR